jgi:hypothetical protein
MSYLNGSRRSLALWIRVARGYLVHHPATRALDLQLGEAGGLGQESATAAAADFGVLRLVHGQAFTVQIAS